MKIIFLLLGGVLGLALAGCATGGAARDASGNAAASRFQAQVSSPMQSASRDYRDVLGSPGPF